MFLYVMWLSATSAVFSLFEGEFFRHQIKGSCLTNQLFDDQMSKIENAMHSYAT